MNFAQVLRYDSADFVEDEINFRVLEYSIEDVNKHSREVTGTIPGHDNQSF